MGHAVLILSVLLLMLLTAAFLLGRHLSRRQYLRDELSPVSRQHIDLFQGGHLSEAAVEAAKARFRELLERGDLAAVEASLRPGMLFVVQVRALAEAAKQLLDEGLDPRPEIMVPLVGAVQELELVREEAEGILAEARDFIATHPETRDRTEFELPYKTVVYMCENLAHA